MIALRPAADPVSSALLAAWDGALFSTSANRRGEPPPTEVAEALAALGGAPGSDAIEVALGPAGTGATSGLPSTIVDVDARPPRLVRAGAIPADRIREVIGDLEEGNI
jgi:tRNA A37 threonylcarbamoyladenosine synthetase subunit TsaC/SUA5/YrdC